MDKQLTANSWLVTAGIVMKHKLASKAFLLSSLFISLLMVGCSQEQEPQVEVKKEIISLSKENQKAFVQTMVSDYLLTSEQLQQKFSEFEKTGDASGFIDYRNQQWTPAILNRRRFISRCCIGIKPISTDTSLNPCFNVMMSCRSWPCS